MLTLMNTITKIRTPFPEKFGVPRQSLLVKEAVGVLSFPKNDFFMEAFRGLEESSHLWLIFEFHLVPLGEFKGLVRPPRFENKKKMGVYATRSPHRPNRLGLSVVEFDSLKVVDDQIVLKVRGVDLVDGTPILDIKPYVPYTDAIVNAQYPFTEAPAAFPVKWLCEPVERVLIEKIIALDPRPAQDKASTADFGASLAGYNIRFRLHAQELQILSAEKIK